MSFVILSLIPEKLSTNAACPMPIAPILCTLEVTTPLFLAGADLYAIQSELLRIPSLRGLLRWWWRAAQATEDLRQLQEQEVAIWGGLPTKDRPHPPRGIVLRSHPCHTPKFTPFSGKTGSAEYYLGYGLGKTNTNPARPGFDVNQQINIEILPHNQYQREQAALALDLLLAFGGLGSRHRRTWGSLTAVKRDGETIKPFSTWQEVKQHLDALLDKVPARRVDGSRLLRTVLGKGARVETAPRTFHTHKALLEFVHAIFKGPNKLHKEAWCFGLPHTKGENALPDGPQWVERRASPIILKATRLVNNHYALSALLTDGAFLDFGNHASDELEFKRQRSRLDTFMNAIRDGKPPAATVGSSR